MLSLNHTSRCVWTFMLIYTWMSHFWCVNNKHVLDAFWRKITTFIINNNDRLNTTLCGEAPSGPLARADRLALCRKTQIRVCNFYVYEYSIRRWKRERIPRIFRSAAPPTVVFNKKYLGNLLNYYRSRNQLGVSFETCHKECCMSKSGGLHTSSESTLQYKKWHVFSAYFLQCTMEKGLPSSAIEKLS